MLSDWSLLMAAALDLTRHIIQRQA